jgi:hypothetical protein
MKTKTRRRKVKNMKGCGSKGCKRCSKSKCSHKRHMMGGCGTCQSGGQTGGNVIYAPVSSVASTILSAGVNVFRTFQGLIPL